MTEIPIAGAEVALAIFVCVLQLRAIVQDDARLLKWPMYTQVPFTVCHLNRANGQPWNEFEVLPPDFVHVGIRDLLELIAFERQRGELLSGYAVVYTEAGIYGLRCHRGWVVYGKLAAGGLGMLA